MLIVSIPYTNTHHVRSQIQLAGINPHIGIELRLDYSEKLNITDIAAIRSDYPLPMIFTLRKKSQGGMYAHSENTRIDSLIKLSTLNPDYMDIEYDVPHDFLKQLNPDVKYICSYHNFDETPTNLDEIFQGMQHPFFYSYKMATQNRTALDALRLLTFTKHHNQSFKLTVIGMGKNGQCTRILSPIFGNDMHYAALGTENATAPGQLTAFELMNTYFLHRLNKSTKIYALLGHPVDLSVGHILHNKAMSLLKQNATYIKLDVEEEELESTMSLCQKLLFAGFSVTMPLKEKIIRYINHIDDKARLIQAVNTVHFQHKKWIGSNTDGEGALAAILNQCDIANKTVVILGAGGSARAIAYTLIQRTANVIILNRHIDKAKKLADQLGCRSDSLHNIKKFHYDLIINTIPQEAYQENFLHEDIFIPFAYAMDIVYSPIKTIFLKKAEKSGCICIPGYHMYVQQALLQLETWFPLHADKRNHIQHVMERYFTDRRQ
jgi:3-dehydroquinate dehydratase/shikimate dehydrogenase